MLNIFSVALGACACGLWIAMIASGLQMLRHVQPGVSTSYLLTHGAAFFTGSKFTAGAAPYLRRLRIAAATFAAVIAAGLVVGLALAGGSGV